MGTHPIFESDFDCLTVMYRVALKTSGILSTIARCSRDKVFARSVSTTPRTLDCATRAANENKLENILRKADQTNDKNSRAKLLQEAVETAEALELPMGHQGRLYDMAATAHMAASHFERAEKYFLIAINRWVQSGVEPESPQIIHLSLQLSQCFQQKGDYAKARSGFNWCKETASKVLEKDSSLNAKAFYGLTLDALGRFMYESGHYGEAVPLMKESLELAIEIDPEDKNRIGVLKINLSSLMAEQGEASEALVLLDSILREESDISLKIQSSVNQAIIFGTKLEEKLKANEILQSAYDEAVKANIPELILLCKRTSEQFGIIIG